MHIVLSHYTGHICRVDIISYIQRRGAQHVIYETLITQYIEVLDVQEQRILFV